MRRQTRSPLSFVVLFAFIACGVAAPETTGPPQQIPVTNPIDGGAPVTVRAVSTEFCSVKILWVFADSGSGSKITFINQADQTAWITVNSVPKKTQVVDAVIFSQSEGTKDAVFVEGDEVEVIVEFLDPNLSFDQWPECGRKRYILGQ
jgi:hypothetical protein